MKYKVAVCDDSKTDREYVSCMVENWAKKKGISYKSVIFHLQKIFGLSMKSNRILTSFFWILRWETWMV